MDVDWEVSLCVGVSITLSMEKRVRSVNGVGFMKPGGRGWE